MFQQFLDTVQERHLTESFTYKSEIDLVRPILKDANFRTSVKHWLEKVHKARNEGPAISGINSHKIQSGLLGKIRKCKDVLEKYHLCNRSLVRLHAKTENFDEIQSKIYYERANILIKTENYEEALESLMMMTEMNEIKVLYRKALCGLKSNNILIFNENLAQLTILYEDFESKSDGVKAELERYRTEYEKLVIKKDLVELASETKDVDESSLEKFRDLSIKVTPEKGRHIIADEFIDDKNKILTEKAFAFVSLRPCFITSDKDINTFDCQNCAKTNIIPILCKKCNHAVYCSVDCLCGHQKIHQYECPGHQRWLWHEIGIAYLAFRTFLEGFEQFQGLLDESFYGKDLEQILENAVEVEFSPEREQYRLLLSLQTHFEDMLQGDLVTFALTACALTLYLEMETSFFKDHDIVKDDEKWEILASSIILRHIGQMVCNAHTMSDTRLEYNGASLPFFKNQSLLKLKRTGLIIRNDETFAGIFPFISLLNHSCMPNISNRFNGARLTISAKGPIPSTNEIFNSYGINYRRISKTERQAALRGQYHFDCECDACLTLDDEFLLFQKLRCFTCHNLLEANFDIETMEIIPKKEEKCGKCGNTFNLEQFDQMMRKISDNVEEIRDQETLKLVLKALKYCNQCVHPYHEVIYFFSKTLINSVGNFDPTFQSEITEVAENMLNICEHLYGKNSVEYLLDRVCAINVLPKNETEIFGLAENVLSDRSLAIFKNIFPTIVTK